MSTAESLIDLIENGLIVGSFDGLYNDDLECACAIDDLCPCREPSLDCCAGYQIPAPADSGADFWIGPRE